MSEFLTRQQQVQRSIERFLENFKKIGRPNLTPAKIRSRISALKDLWRQFQDGNAVLLQAATPEHQKSLDYFTSKCYETTEEIYCTALDHLNEALEELEPVSYNNESARSPFERSPSNSVSLAQLPPIRLPPFDCNLAEWEQFRDRFTSLIVKNPDLTDFARMHFLTSCVKGPALDCIRNLPVTAANFEIAWQTLFKRYEHKGCLLQLHFATLLNLPSVSRESASELQSLRDKVHIAVESLNQLSRSPEELWSDMLVHLVVQRLDASTRKAWKLKTIDHDEPPSFHELDKFITCRTRALEEIASVFAGKTVSKTSLLQTVSLATASANPSAPCPICKAKHLFSVCPLFARGTPSQRRELVKRHGRCFNFLSQSHSSRDCKSKYSCRVCHQRHHSMLHTSSGPAIAMSTEPAVGRATPSNEPPAEVQALLASQTPRGPSPILLATAHVTVNGTNGRALEVRALLDQRSEMTFISEHVAQVIRVRRHRMPTSVSAVGCVHAGTFRHAAIISVSPRQSCSPKFSTTALF